ncbi:MAG TPA: hypothetical protein VFE58_16630 [Tepidisphaeraceae bacterium]|nr:hypothetical protein [Tepidisphaeraceae bacterium]
MRRAPRPLAIVLAASTVTFSMLFLTGCGGDDASRADRNVNEQVNAAYTTDNPLDALKKAAENDKASGASRARAKAMLADAEMLAGNAQMRQIEEKENRIDSLIWELNQLGQSIHTSASLIAVYRSYDPSIVNSAADAHVAEVKGDALTIQKINAKIPALAPLAENISKTQEAIDKQKADVAQLTAQRTQLLDQADQSSQQSESAKGRESVDAYTKASNLRKQAAMVSNQIDTANSQIERLNENLETFQGQQKILAGLVDEYQAGAAATDKGFKSVASEEEAQHQLIKEIYGSPSDKPGLATAATIHSRAAELSAAVNEVDELRKQAEDNLKNAIQHYADAQQAAEDLRRSLDEKMGATSNADAPERLAWEDMKKLINPSTYQLLKSNALQTLGSLYGSNADAIAARVRLAGHLTKALQPAGLKLPADLTVKDGQADLKQGIEETNKIYSEASDLEDNVIAAPLATESQKAAARVEKILTYYAWGNAMAAAGNMNDARKHHAEAVEQVKGAVADGVTIPALPPDIAPAPKVSATTPETTPPVPAKTSAAPSAAGTPADAATTEAVKQSLTTVAEDISKGDTDSLKNFINAAPEQQPMIDTAASLISGSVKLQAAVVAKFGKAGEKAMSQGGMHMETPTPEMLKAELDKVQVMSTGPDSVVLTMAGMTQAIPLKKIGDQWKLDLAGLVKSNPQVGVMLPMMTMMFKPMADGVNKIAADVESGKYATVAEVKAALQKTLPNNGMFSGMNKAVAQQPTPAPSSIPPQ